MCKKWVVIFCLLTGTWTASAQITLPFYADTVFPTYYRQRVTHFLTLLQSKNDIVFLGNSITDGAEWSELFADSRVKNRGISGDISAGVIHRLDATVKGKPAKVFLLIGINDLSRGISPDSVVKNILLIASYLRQETPATALYVQSILPVNNIYGKFETHTNKGELIKQVNTQLQQNASAYHYTFIDLNTVFCDAEGKMNARLTNDGLHLKGAGYTLWKHLVYPYVFNLLPRASILPMPQQLQWESGYFPLYACKTILVKDTALQKEAGLLQQELTTKGIMMQITNTAGGSEPVIEMGIGKTGAPQLPEESYRLQVRPGKIILEANSPHGAFNGIQTLLQLMRDKVMVDACIITDWPAFSWRGYMVDVGRNYQSVDLLKQQIEIMSRYKLNVFHFHATEDIAWRIAIKQYPQLTAPDNMLRNKGQYYSEEELNSLIDYCKERYITFLPEIDMPGHSAAFKTAMKTDMQSDSGLAIIKSILKVFCTTHDFPYLHIGGDEVKITNKNFLPEMIAYAQSLGKKTIGWEPGGNFTNSTIRQLWMDDAGKTSGNSSVQYIDSRHLYLNHMDPLESVVTIFNRQIGGRQQEDKNMLGGTICLWPDRRVANEEDVFRMNPVYPAMLAFAERIWRGGGNPGWVANIGGPGDVRTNEFREFENRLLDQREENFSGLPFLYAQQSGITWKMYGPYSNGGDLSKKFEPETTHLNEGNIKETLRVVGGTVILRHWWYPLVRDIFNEQKENTTWYATTKIWSDEDKTGDFWIGFNNISRSPATDSPQPGTWDNHHSCVWVNGIRVAPPDWKRGGQKGNSEIPLTDEGYEYRAPTRVAFHKGWNEVLIKAPVAGFKGADWQNPVKWMFTFVPAPGY